METKATLLNEDDNLLTLDELAEKLKIQKGWVYQKIHTHSLPFAHVKLGHYLRFPASEIRKYIATQTRPGVRS